MFQIEGILPQNAADHLVGAVARGEAVFVVYRVEEVD